MSELKQAADVGKSNPLLGLDLERLEQEMLTYHRWLDERADDAYRIAEDARKLGLDHKDLSLIHI